MCSILSLCYIACLLDILAWWAFSWLAKCNFLHTKVAKCCLVGAQLTNTLCLHPKHVSESLPHLQKLCHAYPKTRLAFARARIEFFYANKPILLDLKNLRHLNHALKKNHNFGVNSSGLNLDFETLLKFENWNSKFWFNHLFL